MHIRSYTPAAVVNGVALELSHMFRDKPASHLIIILFIGVLSANVLGEAFRLLLHALAGQGSIVELALLNYLSWSVGPMTLNLIILTFVFKLALHINVISILGLFVGWYYFKYSY